MKIRNDQKAMMINRLLTISILLFLTLGANAKKKDRDYPRAEIKVSYNYHEKYMRGNVEYAEHDIPMLLLANSNQNPNVLVQKL